MKNIERFFHPKRIKECARCRDCGRTVHDFIMPNEIWNDVMTGSPIIYLKDGITPSKEGAGGVLCYDCFCERAYKKGYIAVFKCELAHPKRKVGDVPSPTPPPQDEGGGEQDGGVRAGLVAGAGDVWDGKPDPNDFFITVENWNWDQRFDVSEYLNARDAWLERLNRETERWRWRWEWYRRLEGEIGGMTAAGVKMWREKAWKYDELCK